MREITLTDTITKNTFDTERIPNHPVTVYDTSGAYTDPAIDIDLKKDYLDYENNGYWIETMWSNLTAFHLTIRYAV